MTFGEEKASEVCECHRLAKNICRYIDQVNIFMEYFVNSKRSLDLTTFLYGKAKGIEQAGIELRKEVSKWLD